MLLLLLINNHAKNVNFSDEVQYLYDKINIFIFYEVINLFCMGFIEAKYYNFTMIKLRIMLQHFMIQV
jgi:hypothetical protein